MKRVIGILAAALCLWTAAACADTWAGSVQAAQTVTAVSPADGVAQGLTLTVGQTVAAGEALGSIRAEKVFAPVDGTVAAIHSQTGDRVDGTVLEIAPVSRYAVTCTVDGVARTPENALIHMGETLWIRCAADGSHTAMRRVTAIDGAGFGVETTAGELYVGEAVYLFRDADFTADARVGKGTVTAQETVKVSGSGVLLTLRPAVGDQIEKGQWLFSLAGSEETLITAPAAGVVTAVGASEGDAVREQDVVAEIATATALRITVDAGDISRFAPGSAWYYTRGDDPHETHFPCTVSRVLLGGENGTAAVELTAEADLPIGLSVLVTDEPGM